MDVVQGAVGDFEAVEERAGRGDLVEEDRRGDSEAGVDGVVVEDEGIGAVVDGSGAGADSVGAVGWEKSADLYVVGVVVVDAAAYDEIT